MLEACVVGNGVAGKACALALARTGRWHVTLLERKGADALHSRGGEGLLLHPRGQAALGALDAGALASLREQAALVAGTDFCAGGKRLRARYPEGHYALGLRRDLLHEELLGRLLHEPRIDVHYGRGVRGARIGKSACCYRLDADRSYAKMEDGSVEGPFDLVVAADGAESAVRRGLAPFGLRCVEGEQPAGALWALVGVGEGADGGATGLAGRRVLVRGSDALLKALPVGAPQGVMLALHQRRPALEQTRREGPVGWARRVAELMPEVGELAHKVVGEGGSGGQLRELGTVAASVLQPTFGGSLALIGDAAHAASPLLEHGTELALVDAVALVQELEDADGDVARGLAAFASKRSWRAKQAVGRARVASELLVPCTGQAAAAAQSVCLQVLQAVPGGSRVLEGALVARKQ